MKWDTTLNMFLTNNHRPYSFIQLARLTLCEGRTAVCRRSSFQLLQATAVTWSGVIRYNQSWEQLS